jgi:hypothetical protein
LTDLLLPPHPDAEELLHQEYAWLVGKFVREQLERIETPGFAFTIGWPATYFFPEDEYRADPGEIEVRGFFCLDCTKLHRRIIVRDDEGYVLAANDFDTGADLMDAYTESDEDDEAE